MSGIVTFDYYYDDFPPHLGQSGSAHYVSDKTENDSAVQRMHDAIKDELGIDLTKPKTPMRFI